MVIRRNHSRTPAWRRWWFASLTAVLSVVLLTAGNCTNGPSTVQPSQRPNIVVILTDDLDTEYPGGSWISYFPILHSLLAEQGTTFTNSFVSLAMCCPSRTSSLRGQYAHNTQIFTNTPPNGGFQKVHDLGLEESTVATWLHDAGYRTVLLGKYLNGYPSRLGHGYTPPGWDEFSSDVTNGMEQFDYEFDENGTTVKYGHSPEDYLQDVIRAKAIDFIRRSTSSEHPQPFFMWIATHSPHDPAAFAPRHANAFPNVRAPRPPTFNEEDVRGHPEWLRKQPLLSDDQIAEIDVLYRRRLQSMLAVEDTVRDIIHTLQETRQLENTYLIFTSDNGFHMGQHRLTPGKSTAFEEDLRVPLIVRGPGIPASRVLPHLTVNIDLAPTFAELAGLPAPDFVDGRSLVPLLRPDPLPVQQWRQIFLLEHGGTLSPPLQGVHSADLVYIEYPTTHEQELYDLKDDPYQHKSIIDIADPALLARLKARLDLLRTCRGDSCRKAERLPFL